MAGRRSLGNGAGAEKQRRVAERLPTGTHSEPVEPAARPLGSELAETGKRPSIVDRDSSRPCSVKSVLWCPQDSSACHRLLVPGAAGDPTPHIVPGRAVSP